MNGGLTSSFRLLEQTFRLFIRPNTIIRYVILGGVSIVLLVVPFLLINAMLRIVMRLITTGQFGGETGQPLIDQFGIPGFVIYEILLAGLSVFGASFISSAMNKLHKDIIEGTNHSFLFYILEGWKRTPRLFSTYIEMFLFILLGVFLLIIPGIILKIRYTFAPTIAVLEDSFVKPLDTSTKLVKQFLWTILGRIIFFFLLQTIPGMLLRLFAPGPIALVWLLTTPFFGLLNVLFYYDVKKAYLTSLPPQRPPVSSS